MFNFHYICIKCPSAPCTIPVMKSTFDNIWYNLNWKSVIYFSVSSFFLPLFCSLYSTGFVYFSLVFRSTVNLCGGQKFKWIAKHTTKSNRKKMSNWYRYIQLYDNSLYWLSTDTSIKSGQIKLVLWVRIKGSNDFTSKYPRIRVVRNKLSWKLLQMNQMVTSSYPR